MSDRLTDLIQRDLRDTPLGTPDRHGAVARGRRRRKVRLAFGAAAGVVAVALVGFGVPVLLSDRTPPGHDGDDRRSGVAEDRRDTEGQKGCASAEHPIDRRRLREWMEKVILSTGAPGGEALSHQDVRPERGELRVDAASYTGRFAMYVFAEPPDHVNIDIESIPKLAGRSGVKLHHAKTDVGPQQFIAAAEHVWVTFHINPINQEVQTGVMESWLRNYVEVLEKNPPPGCEQREVSRGTLGFLPNEGWNTATTATIETFVYPTAWAWTADLDVEFPEFPTHLLPTMNDTDAFITVELPFADQSPSDPNEEFPAGELPLSLDNATVHHSWEGQPHDDVILYRILRTINGIRVDVRIYFASSEPDQATLAMAEEQLRTLTLPAPPTPPETKSCAVRPVAGECGELQWAAEVAEEAGFRFSFQEGGGAPEVTRSHVTFMFWAFVREEEGSRSAILAEEGYKKVGEAAGISIFSDGLRVTWQVHGLYAWLSGVEGIDASTPGVRDIVEASVRVPYQPEE